ncbi:hypothetical protein A6P54_02655 [Bacillus sp. MKU004]|nr:hypothetical protein A6P54_02655 [Bacillus sp. MKU004]
MRAFLILWLGQVLSLTGIGIASFALGVWVYKETGSVTAFSLIAFFTFLPDVILSPVAGVFVDRWDKRKVMLVCDIAGSIVAIFLVTVLFIDKFDIWYIYLAVGINSAFKAFQWLGYYSSVSLLVPKKHLGRASGLLQAGESFSKLLGPILGASFLAFMGIKGVLILNFVTYTLAIISILIVKMPKFEKNNNNEQPNFFKEMVFGIKYLIKLRGLVWLLVFFMCLNFSIGMSEVLITPLVMSFSDSQTLGYVMSASGVGMLCGSILISFWGGPKKGKIKTIILFSIVQGLLMMLIGIKPNPWIIGIAFFGTMFCVPIMAGCSQALWLSKVSPDTQGRVFSIKGTLAWSTLPLAQGIAGPLSDNVFEPLFQSNDSILSSTVGSIIGIGEGRGVGFIIILLGFFIISTGFIFLFNKNFRGVEENLPDQVLDNSNTGEKEAVSI